MDIANYVPLIRRFFRIFLVVFLFFGSLRLWGIDIAFAHRNVTVYMPPGEESGDHDKKAAAGAAAAAASAQAEAEQQAPK